MLQLSVFFLPFNQGLKDQGGYQMNRNIIFGETAEVSLAVNEAG